MLTMNKSTMPAPEHHSHWFFAKTLQDMQDQHVTLVRLQGKQIALFKTERGFLACNNRCPHEGYPLTEGSLSGQCLLTCNWHNWKFDLRTGNNLLGGDRLRTYPIEVRGKEIWINLSDPPYSERYDTILNNLRDAFDDHSYDRMGREIARLQRIGGNPLDALRIVIKWSWERMQFGWTHAYAGMADWLALYLENDDAEIQLTCLLESIAHVSFDVLREQSYPFTTKRTPFSETAFLEAIEMENENTAVSLVRGGLQSQLTFGDFEHALTRAALTHYNDFGHSLIYVTKAKYLIEKLGPDVIEPLLLSLTRSLVFATREDRIPEFRGYGAALNAWGRHNGVTPAANLWYKQGINKSLSMTVDCSRAEPEKIYTALLLTNAINLLNFDITRQDKRHVTVAGNIGWLDLTHAVTFANAVRKQCTRYPELWPQGLLQMACFNGRNATAVSFDQVAEQWLSTSGTQQTLQEILDRLFDHGQGEYIVSVHWLKTSLAVREEISLLSEKHGETLVAALNRFIRSPMKRRHAMRTAYQSLKFVEDE